MQHDTYGMTWHLSYRMHQHDLLARGSRPFVPRNRARDQGTSSPPYPLLAAHKARRLHRARGGEKRDLHFVAQSVDLALAHVPYLDMLAEEAPLKSLLPHRLIGLGTPTALHRAVARAARDGRTLPRPRVRVRTRTDLALQHLWARCSASLSPSMCERVRAGGARGAVRCLEARQVDAALERLLVQRCAVAAHGTWFSTGSAGRGSE